MHQCNFDFFCSDCDTISELEDILGKGTIQTTEGVKSVGQQLLLLQDQVSIFSHKSISQVRSSMRKKEILLEILRNTIICEKPSERYTDLSYISLKLKKVKEENKKIIENYTSERTMRKKYYNMVEDMKGTIKIKCFKSVSYCHVIPSMRLFILCYCFCRRKNQSVLSDSASEPCRSCKWWGHCCGKNR